MKVLSSLLVIVFLLSACVPKSDLDEANKKIAELQAQIAATQAEAEKIKAQAATAQSETEKIRAEAEAARNENQNLEARNSQLQAKVDEKPELPVIVSFRKAMTGPGNVAVINTTIKTQVPVLISVHSASLGTTKQIERYLDPNRSTELGHMEGVVINNGDSITIENKNYSPINIVVK